MKDQEAHDQASAKPGTYTLGYGEATHQWMRQRTAATHAKFLLPHISAGMRVLDCGCGAGSITLGLAEAAAPGEVIGIDVEPVQIERAQSLAAAQGATNVQFKVADITCLPFPDASFDAVFAHAVLYHLADPHHALKECRRVLRPTGCIGIRDIDYSV
jgi:ubiquinone/menaquinone biosynthesis C-methylase UbiE